MGIIARLGGCVKALAGRLRGAAFVAARQILPVKRGDGSV
jgi:hypothetical protein